MTIFKRIFGHERSASGKTLDRVVFGCILGSAIFGFYAGWKAFFIVLAISAIVIFGVPFVVSLKAKSLTPKGDKAMSDMKWSRFAYCAALTAATGILIGQGASPWITIPLGAFAAWWTFVCTRALWSDFSYRIAIWRLHQAPSWTTDWPATREVKRWEWLSNPKLDSLIAVATVLSVLCFPALLWVPLIIWVFK